MVGLARKPSIESPPHKRLSQMEVNICPKVMGDSKQCGLLAGPHLNSGNIHIRRLGRSMQLLIPKHESTGSLEFCQKPFPRSTTLASDPYKMHLPPLDVAVYPVVTMSHGRHGRKSSRPSPAVSSSSSSSASSTNAVTPDFTTIQKAIRSVFRSSEITVQKIQRVQGRLYQIYLSELFDGTSLVLKCPPAYNTRLLRHEKHGLETERKTLETLREYTQLPVAQVMKYSSNSNPSGLTFLMMSHVPGRRLSELADYITSAQRYSIDRTLGAHVRSLTSLSATQYGLTHRVFAKKGYTSWREAFLALLEAVLRDAEDMLVTVPHESIRYYVGRHSNFLDEVTEPRLVAFDVCDPQNVLVNEQTKQVTGLIGFSNVIWGDPLMSGGIANGSEAFFEGYGQCPSRTGGARARILMYNTYRATLDVVAHHYRPHLDIDELEARRALTSALNELARM